jgi:pimeloyl-ACP methyl ester carboxylesterase
MLIIPGSGPTDRDGNNPMGVKAATYKLLAEGLSERGIATVRIDKRGMFASAGAVKDGNSVTVDDYAADVRSWIRSIRKSTGASCIWLLGHSEGALVALAADGGSKEVCGLVLVAAPGRPLGQVLREQLRANPANAPVLDQALAAITRLEAGSPVDTAAMHPGLMPLFAPSVQKFMMSLLSYDPAKLLSRYDKPVLIVHGQRDLQVSEEDARRLKKANGKARLVIIPGANHVLKAVSSDDRAANMAAYANPALPLAPGVAQTIAGFVAKPPGR